MNPRKRSIKNWIFTNNNSSSGKIRNHITLIKILHTLNLTPSALFSTEMCLLPLKKKNQPLNLWDPHDSMVNLLISCAEIDKRWKPNTPRLIPLLLDNYYSYLHIPTTTITYVHSCNPHFHVLLLALLITSHVVTLRNVLYILLMFFSHLPHIFILSSHF